RCGFVGSDHERLCARHTRAPSEVRARASAQARRHGRRRETHGQFSRLRAEEVDREVCRTGEGLNAAVANKSLALFHKPVIISRKMDAPDAFFSAAMMRRRKL